MLFNSHEFMFLFLPITILVFYLLAKLKSKNMVVSWLAFMSLVFYAWWDPKFLILLFASICFNYTIGYVLIHVKQKQNNIIKPIHILVLGIAVNLSTLAYYKYFNFFITNINSLLNLSVPVESIILPIGISFFTFTQIAFLVDVYRGFVEEYKFTSYVLFVTFFPHLIAGPILHHKEMMPQFEDERNLNVDWKNITVGTVIFIFGLSKKVIIADNLATFATPIFNAVSQGRIPNLIEAWVGALAYSLQLYFDFSGYSDMAIGLALVFNIRLPVNFFSPYKATSIIDFWRRWHMTLSRYLRDYLYIPLGGNRHGEYKRLRNLIITMILGGLWHGAGWTFIIWGTLHGLYLVINHSWRKLNLSIPNSVAWGLTFISVIIAWVFFRADTVHSAIFIIKGMFALNGISLPSQIAHTLPMLETYGIKFSGLMPLTKLSGSQAVLWVGMSLFIAIFLPNIMEITAKYCPALGIEEKSIETRWAKYIQWNPSYLWSIVIGIMAIVSILAMVQASEFLYFQF